MKILLTIIHYFFGLLVIAITVFSPYSFFLTIKKSGITSIDQVLNPVGLLAIIPIIGSIVFWLICAHLSWEFLKPFFHKNSK